jgi:hypothetical protein
MVLVPNNQDLSQASGVIDVAAFEQIYHSCMDDALASLGRTVTFHLEPSVEQDVSTQGQPQAGQFNPFFGGVATPNTNTRGRGTKITTREVEYLAHIRVGPMGADDTDGIGDLKDNEVMITVVVEALPHVKEALSMSIEGRRYNIKETRPIGFSVRRYLMVKGEEIEEQANTGGVNDG